MQEANHDVTAVFLQDGSEDVKKFVFVKIKSIHGQNQNYNI